MMKKINDSIKLTAEKKTSNKLFMNQRRKSFIYLYTDHFNLTASFVSAHQRLN